MEPQSGKQKETPEKSRGGEKREEGMGREGGDVEFTTGVQFSLSKSTNTAI